MQEKKKDFLSRWSHPTKCSLYLILICRSGCQLLQVHDLGLQVVLLPDEVESLLMLSLQLLLQALNLNSGEGKCVGKVLRKKKKLIILTKK